MNKLPKFFDIHAHVNDTRFDDDRSEVFVRMQEHDVWGTMVGTAYDSSKAVIAIAELFHEGIYATIGVHPIDDQNEVFNETLFAELVKSKKVIAIGECGIDYSRLAEVEDITIEKKRQRELFELQVDFAIKHNLPLMLHIRDSNKLVEDAHRDLIGILIEKKKIAGPALRGNVHFFSQTINIAREFFALDFTISFTGVITFTHDYDEVIREAPLERIMAETDSPYVAPVPYRGKRNEPIYVEEIVKKIAEIRGEDFENVRTAMVQNALRIFNIKV